MTDGLGISGAQGVFQRCAEETLRVLRVGSDVIMTVLEVFKHDPLHSWYIFFQRLRPPRRVLTLIRQDSERHQNQERPTQRPNNSL